MGELMRQTSRPRGCNYPTSTKFVDELRQRRSAIGSGICQPTDEGTNCGVSVQRTAIVLIIIVKSLDQSIGPTHNDYVQLIMNVVNDSVSWPDIADTVDSVVSQLYTTTIGGYEFLPVIAFSQKKCIKSF